MVEAVEVDQDFGAEEAILAIMGEGVADVGEQLCG